MGREADAFILVILGFPEEPPALASLSEHSPAAEGVVSAKARQAALVSCSSLAISGPAQGAHEAVHTSWVLGSVCGGSTSSR